MKNLINHLYHSKTQDYLFITIAFFVVIFAYFYPLIKYPYEVPTPWPEAYNVIQQEIINQKKVPPDVVPQFGEWQKSDMVYFLNHHLMIVSQRLISGLPTELNERFLSFALTFIIFLAAYLFFRYLFGGTMGFVASILFVFLPRNFNYYVNINGEFLSFIIFFLALYFWFRFKKEKKISFLFLSALFSGVLPILCLITFGIFILVIFSDFMAEMIIKKNRLKIFKKNIIAFLVVLAASLIISLIPLLLTGNINIGKSSSVGSLFSHRSQQEMEFEKKYYQDFATYGNEFIKYPPFLREIYYLTLDGVKLDYFFLIYLPLFAAGLILSLIMRNKKIMIFGLTSLTVMLLFGIFLYSSFFNYSVYNSALRFLLYFYFPIIIIGTLALGWFCWKNAYVLPIFLLTIIISAIPIIKYSAWSTNMYPALYAKPYKETLLWLKENTPKDALVLTNDWTNGQVWLEANRLDLVEGGKASAAYSTYENIYQRLDDGRKIFRLDILEDETAKLLKNRKIEYLVVWNRPTAYNIYPFAEAKKKMEQDKTLTQVFASQEDVVDPNSQAIFKAESYIYTVNIPQPLQ